LPRWQIWVTFTKVKKQYEENDSEEEADEFAGLPKTNL
jgi:hypothetical protein